jgi:hypothetical protein
MKGRISALYVWYAAFSPTYIRFIIDDVVALSCRLLDSTRTTKYQHLRARVRTRRLVLGQWQDPCPLYNKFNFATGHTWFVCSLFPPWYGFNDEPHSFNSLTQLACVCILYSQV